MDIFEKQLVDIASVDHPIFKITDIIMDSSRVIWDPEQCWSMFSITNLNHFLTPQHYGYPDGTLPTVHSVSFRFPPAPVHSEPFTFKLHMTNVSDQKGYWAIFTRPPSKTRGGAKLNPKPVGGARLSEMSICRDNHDQAHQLWATKFHFNPDIAYKIPSTFNSLKDLTHFEVFPASGSLKSKESQPISFKHTYTSVGLHEVSFLLRVYPNVYVWLDLKARTLETNQPILQLMHRSYMTFHPVALSDIDPPVQMFWMYNGGNVPASFTVDLEPFEKLTDDNYGHPIIKCLSPKGEVPPRSWAPIKLRFSPLEYTTYSAHLIIYPSYNKAPYQVVLMGGAAINPGVSLRPAANAENVRQFALMAHGVPVTMSPSHITIGHLIPTGHTVTRMVFLTNLHARNTMKYYWQNVPIEGGGMISFQPNCGRLTPKEETSCKIVIKAGDTATVLSAMVQCKIEDETASVLYEFVLNQWRDFINTQRRDSEQPSNEVTHKPEKPESYNRLLAVSVYIGSAFGQFDKISDKEKARMGWMGGSLQFDNCGTLDRDLNHLSFTATGSQLCQSIISDMIWDLVQSSTFKSFCKVATKRKAPLFEEYASMEDSTSAAGGNENKNEVLVGDETIPVQVMSDIMEKSIFNILHEMAERFAHASTQQKWFEVPPIQPKALVDVEKYKELFQ